MSSVPSDFVKVHTSAHWILWAEPSYITEYGSYLTTSLLDYPESLIARYESDFGYTIFPLKTGESSDGVHMDLVLDPAAQGGAHTGTVFGIAGVSLSPDAVYNVYQYGTISIPAFWYYLLICHETCNVWTGFVAVEWPWADGSSLWSGESPFPSAVDIIILNELKLTTSSEAQSAMELSNPFVSLFYDIQKKYGWGAYRRFFSLVRSNKITNWSIFAEPLETSVLCLFLSSACRANLLSNFTTAGVAITSATLAQAEAMYPKVKI